MLAENWARKAREFERELDVIRDAMRRVDEVAAATPVSRAS